MTNSAQLTQTSEHTDLHWGVKGKGKLISKLGFSALCFTCILEVNNCFETFINQTLCYRRHANTQQKKKKLQKAYIFHCEQVPSHVKWN